MYIGDLIELLGHGHNIPSIKKKKILTGHFSSWRPRDFFPFLENFCGQYLHLIFILCVSES